MRNEPRPIAHIYTLPDDRDYVRANLDFAAPHRWFVPYRLPGETHFPVLESLASVGRIIHEFFSGIDLSGADSFRSLRSIAIADTVPSLTSSSQDEPMRQHR
jgi:hypothetical protein